MEKIITILSLVVSFVGICIAIRAYNISLCSQKLQNAQALVNAFYHSLRENDIGEFRHIIMLRGESAGGDNNGHYMGDDGKLYDFGGYFTEGPPDGGALDRIVHNLNRVCIFARDDSVNLQFFYSELGHYIEICYEILNAMGGVYEHIRRCHEEYEQKYSDVPVNIIEYIE